MSVKMKRRSKTSVFNDIYYQPYSNLSRIKLYNSTKDSRSMIQRMQLMKSLPVHTGCVNSICWNESGEYILSGSDDQRIIITHGHTFKVLTEFKTIHRANIFSAKFLPCDRDNQIVSCAGDGIILFTDLNYPAETMSNQFTCHSGTTYEVITIPNDPHTFLSCGEDGTVRWFDLRQKTKCLKQHCKEDVLISCRRAVTTIAVNHTAAYQLAIGCSDSRVRLFDRRMIATRDPDDLDDATTLRPVSTYTVPRLEDRSYRITSLCFSPDGDELLASYSSDHLYLFSIKDEGCTQLSASEASGSEVAAHRRPAQPHSSSMMRRLRLRGDWSDTGPNARPEREADRDNDEAQPAHATLMQRMTDVLSRMLNDPATRAALNNNNNATDARQSEANDEPSASRDENNAREEVAPSNNLSDENNLPNIHMEDSMAPLNIPPEENFLPNFPFGENIPPNIPPEENIPPNVSPEENIPPNIPPEQNIPPNISSEENLPLNIALGGIVVQNVPLETDPPSDDEYMPLIFFTEEMVIPSAYSGDDQPSYEDITPPSEPFRSAIMSMHTSLTESYATLPEQFSTSSNQVTQSLEGSQPNLQYPLTIDPRPAVPTDEEARASLYNPEMDEHFRRDSPLSPLTSSCSSDMAWSSQAAPAESEAPEPVLDASQSSSDAADNVVDASHVDCGTSSGLPADQRPGSPEESGNTAPSPSHTRHQGRGNAATPSSSSGHVASSPARALFQRVLDNVASRQQANALRLVSQSTQTLRGEQQRTEPDGSSSGEYSPVDSDEEDTSAWYYRSGLARGGARGEQGEASTTAVKMTYTGHRNARTMIKEACFWGRDHVMSGSDCGHVFVWDRRTAELVCLLPADQHVVNCLQPHPTLPLLATAGIDHDIKLWAPTAEAPDFDAEFAESLTRRNEVMLEETRDTITVPASFMIRMLACLNQIRRGGRPRGLGGDDPAD